MKKVAVVILNWNGKELMEEFLPSVVNYSPREWAEVVVADNGSSDASVAMLKEQFPTVRILQLDTNYGFAEGYNQAMKYIDAEYTVLLNSDVEVTPGWLEAPVALLDQDTSVACVQPKILAQRNQSFFEYAGAAGGFMDRYGYPYCRGRVFDVVEEDKQQYNTSIDILWASGACLFIRTAVYKTEGGLDANFFAHQEEVDLCWRLRCRGYRLVCVPDSVVYHVGGATLNVENPRKTFLNFRNNLLMMYKNLPQHDLSYVMHVRFWLDYLAAFKFLVTGQPRNAWAVVKARRAFLRMKSAYVPVRKENLAKTTLPSIPEIRQGSLLAAFYLKGKKTYAELQE
ncbi:MAG: glycosyltransferase family 2 protein [Tannerellaceae bacterium]|nr:glycosyltransferase family 2 protein [Tannerellaceae bacterium]